MHDWSKFHPVEFFESVKYYQGISSPIPFCKLVNGVSYAWQHHKGHNPHHYEYWVDNLDGGHPTYHLMPYEYVMERTSLLKMRLSGSDGKKNQLQLQNLQKCSLINL